MGANDLQKKTQIKKELFKKLERSADIINALETYEQNPTLYTQLQNLSEITPTVYLPKIDSDTDKVNYQSEVVFQALVAKATVENPDEGKQMRIKAVCTLIEKMQAEGKLGARYLLASNYTKKALEIAEQLQEIEDAKNSRNVVSFILKRAKRIRAGGFDSDTGRLLGYMMLPALAALAVAGGIAASPTAFAAVSQVAPGFFAAPVVLTFFAVMAAVKMFLSYKATKANYNEQRGLDLDKKYTELNNAGTEFTQALENLKGHEQDQGQDVKQGMLAAGDEDKSTPKATAKATAAQQGPVLGNGSGSEPENPATTSEVSTSPASLRSTSSNSDSSS